MTGDAQLVDLLARALDHHAAPAGPRASDDPTWAGPWLPLPADWHQSAYPDPDPAPGRPAVAQPPPGPFVDSALPPHRQPNPNGAQK